MSTQISSVRRSAMLTTIYFFMKDMAPSDDTPIPARSFAFRLMHPCLCAWICAVSAESSFFLRKLSATGRDCATKHVVITEFHMKKKGPDVFIPNLNYRATLFAGYYVFTWWVFILRHYLDYTYCLCCESGIVSGCARASRYHHFEVWS